LEERSVGFELKIDKLKKLLALTASANDNEALAAIRKANSLLTESNKSWTDVFADGSNAQIEQLKNAYKQLCQNYNLLANKYNNLIFQVTATLRRPQIKGPYRKRVSRF
jgi:hypothetical protein